MACVTTALRRVRMAVEIVAVVVMVVFVMGDEATIVLLVVVRRGKSGASARFIWSLEASLPTTERKASD